MPPSRSPLPIGFRLDADRQTRTSDGGRVVDGGSPWRMLRLSSRGSEVAGRLLAGAPVAGEADGVLARRLVESGLAHPLPPATTPVSLLVVVPVRDRAHQLDECLAVLAPLPVVVVDDGSRDPAAIADVAGRHGARLVRRPESGGPAAARNAGLAVVESDAVAFVDSDCRATAATLRAAARHLADPVVAAVAPRVLSTAAGDAGKANPVRRRGPLDMGEQPATVSPGSRVSYVPSTAVVVRRGAVDEVGGFDESLRYGEDVDLCWRLHDRGWAVRYDPRVAVGHVEPDAWTAELARRFRYGTSAGPLARRHPGALRGPSLRGLVAPVTLLRAAGVDGVAPPPEVMRRVAATAPMTTAAGLLRWATPVWCPPAAALRTAPWRALSTAADEAAYGAGVWWGCLRARTLEPVLPAVSARRTTRSP
jgi:mycofactocin system glycosyltransferase